MGEEEVEGEVEKTSVWGGRVEGVSGGGLEEERGGGEDQLLRKG